MKKKILITGENSYVGSSFHSWLSENEPETECIELSVRGDEWKNLDFSKFDSILHVAGIAHVNSKIFTDEDYYNINTNLTLEVATKAKIDGVPHFVFMSSIIVYNDSKINDGRITKTVIPHSKNAYGDSKLKAEEGLRLLNNDSFKVSIVRPPMIYGPGSKGNYPRLAKLARKISFFPDYQNRRSMLFIDNLSIFLNELCSIRKEGVFFPQNTEQTCTSELVRTIAHINNKNIHLIKIFNPFMNLLVKNETMSKVFGNLYYDFDSNLGIGDKFIKLNESIVITEREQYGK